LAAATAILPRENEPQERDRDHEKEKQQAAVHNPVLTQGTLSCYCVGDAREGDHCVERQINSG
jgi:hypothetical protein